MFLVSKFLVAEVSKRRKRRKRKMKLKEKGSGGGVDDGGKEEANFLNFYIEKRENI